MLTPRDQLLTGHDQFQRLVQEHSQYSQRLESLTQKRYLTDDEKLEEVRLKKLKLRLKDQMQSLEVQVHRQSGWTRRAARSETEQSGRCIKAHNACRWALSP